MNLKYKILGVGLLLSFLPLYGQDCVRQIRTKYDSAQNNELSSLYPGQINPWLNTFNFAEIGGAGFNSIHLNESAGWNLPGFAGGSMLMTNPFSPDMGSQYAYLRYPSLGAPSSKDIHWADGWELMWMNTGFYPNGDSVNRSKANRIISGAQPLANPSTPYIVLYNRYQGKLRVFANLFTDFNSFGMTRPKITQVFSGIYLAMTKHWTNPPIISL
jgi:hypothetical protein